MRAMNSLLLARIRRWLKASFSQLSVIQCSSIGMLLAFILLTEYSVVLQREYRLFGLVVIHCERFGSVDSY